MEDKKTTSKPNNFFLSSNAQKVIIAIVIILVAMAMAGRKQFVLDPYENSVNIPQIHIITAADNIFSHIHPLYSKENYIPPALNLVSPSLLFSAWFHVFSAIAFWVLVIGAVFILIRLGGFTNYQSMVITLFSLFIGNLITRELLDIPLLGPAPYVGYPYYDIRILVIPLSVLGLIAMFKRHFITGGVLIGLATFFHIKFGFRFFSLLFLSLLVWKFWGSRRLGLSQKDVIWKNIVSLAMVWGGGFIISYLSLRSSMHFFDSLDLPRSQPLISQLAWLISNEPDDYLVSYYFREDRPFFGFLCMALAIWAFCETIIRLSTANETKKFAVVWEIATLGAMIFWGFGFLFESYLIDWLPLSLAHSITILRYWDLIWVIVIGFWITFLVATATVSQKIAVSFGKSESSAGMFVGHCIVVFFIFVNMIVFVKNKNGEVVHVSDFRSGEKPFLAKMEYVQICTPATPGYNRIYGQAVRAIQAGDDKGFQEALFHLNAIYSKLKVNLKNPPDQNPDSVYLNAINHSANGRFTKYIAETTEVLVNVKREETYLWSCLHSEPGIHSRSVRVPTKDYLNAVDWVKLNLPSDKAVIQPPYLPKFPMLSQHAGFWDGKFDQHMMYLINGYYEIGLHRLRSIAGPHAIDLEAGTRNGSLGPKGREYFLGLTKKDIIGIRQDYPAYGYLLTENKNLHGYPKMYSNQSLTLYDISDH